MNQEGITKYEERNTFTCGWGSSHRSSWAKVPSAQVKETAVGDRVMPANVDSMPEGSGGVCNPPG